LPVLRLARRRRLDQLHGGIDEAHLRHQRIEFGPVPIAGRHVEEALTSFQSPKLTYSPS
jgi:hypothetical protein